MPIEYDPSRDGLRRPERPESVFAQGQPVDEFALAAEAARLAYVRAEASTTERARLENILRMAGFSALTVFDHPETDGQGYGAMRGDGLALLAFRGTQPDRAGDFTTNMGFVLRTWTLGCGRVHAGFGASALGLWPQVQTWLNGPARARKELLVCGHSLGAAIATLLAAPARASRLITLGSPRVGDAAFASSLDNTPDLTVTRIVNCCDMVTEIPPTLLGFAHAGHMLYIDRNGCVVSDPAPSVIVADRLRARGDYFARYAFRLGALFVRDLADHAPVNYLRAFWP